MAETSVSRVVFQRSKEGRFLRGLGIGIYVLMIVLLLVSLSRNWNWFIWTTIAGLLIVFLRGFVISIREIFRRVVLLQDYIAFNSWLFLPKVYRYEQIASVETVEIREDEWSIEPETYVKVVFNDGAALKVQKSLVSVREFRKQLSTRAGKKFRKQSKKKWVKK